LRYKASTLLRAQGVFLKNTKLDLMLGFCVKQFIGIARPNSSQPNNSTSWINISSNVTPCSGLFGCSFGFDAGFMRGLCGAGETDAKGRVNPKPPNARPVQFCAHLRFLNKRPELRTRTFLDSRWRFGSTFPPRAGCARRSKPPSR